MLDEETTTGGAVSRVAAAQALSVPATNAAAAAAPENQSLLEEVANRGTARPHVELGGVHGGANAAAQVDKHAIQTANKQGGDIISASNYV